MKQFKHYKKLIIEELKSFILKKTDDFSQINQWGQDLLKRIEDFTTGGKTIRGGLVCLASEVSGNVHPDAPAVAVAMELVQSSLLIHDDIMDEDLIRRGSPSFFYQYKALGDKEKIDKSYHFGESMGICAGDIGFFLAFEILTAMKNCNNDLKNRLIQCFASELSFVGLAQMQDVYFGESQNIASENDILKLYRYKTARYTFSLPMMLGAILSGADENTIQDFAQLGESMGVLFQIIDDELDLFGDSTTIGKPSGSDVRENKKTLYHYYLYSMANQVEKEKLDKIFGNSAVGETEIKKIHHLLRQKGIIKIIEDKKHSFIKESGQILAQMKVSESVKSSLKELLEYLIHRKK